MLVIEEKSILSYKTTTLLFFKGEVHDPDWLILFLIIAAGSQ